MFKATLVAALPLLALASSAQAAEQRFTVESFDGIRAAGPHNIIVTTGKDQSVRAVGDQDDLDKLEVRVSGSTLRIGQKNSSGWFGSGHMDPVTIYVTTHQLSRAQLAGSGDVSVDRMQGGDVALSLSGSGNLSVGAVKATRLDVSLAGSGDVKLKGTCDSADISIAGSGDVSAPALKCQTMEGKIAGSGNIAADVSKSAKLRVMGSGDITLTGGAKCDITAMGSGRVRCGATS